jgi:ribose transport system permease protein
VSAAAITAGVRRSWQPQALREHGSLLMLVALYLAFAFGANGFFTVDNQRVLIQNAALPALIACGVTVGILAGQFDLSVGGTFGFAGIIGAVAANHVGIVGGFAAGIAAGVAIGAVNGFLVAVVGIQSFLVTLATGFILLGSGLLLTAGTGSWTMDDFEQFFTVAEGTFLTLQYRVWIVLAIFTLTGAVLARSRSGRQVYAVGGSPLAARIAGVRTKLVILSTFLVSGGFAALAGMIGAADTGVAQYNGGAGAEFSAITAVIVGGTSVLGGRGSVWRTLVGVLLLAVIANGFTVLYIDPVYNSLVQGAIILVAITIEARLRVQAPA